MQIVEYIQKVLQFVYETFSSEILIIQLIWICIPLFALFFVLSVVFLKLYRMKQRRIQRVKSSLKPKLQELTLGYLTNPDLEGHYVRDLKAKIHKRLPRLTLLEIILNLHSSVDGDFRESLEKLYGKLNYHTYAFKNLNSRKWHLKAAGLRELMRMHGTDNLEPLVVKNLHYRNKVVREEMQLAYLQLNATEAIEHLAQSKFPISEWHQIEMLDILVEQRFNDFKAVEALLISENPTAISLGLKIVKSYSLVNYRAELFNLLQHPNSTVANQALDAIQSISLYDRPEPLQMAYHTAKSYHRKNRILKVLKAFRIYPEHKINRLKEELLEEFDYKKITIDKVLNYK